MSFKSSVGWADISINPIKGRCKGGCWYCFYSGKRGMLNRFKQDSRIYLHLPAFDKLPQKPKKVFLCSTHDLFGSWIPNVWREYIFYEVKNRPQHTFQILTKYPQNIDRAMPDNAWLGTTINYVDHANDLRLEAMARIKARLKFISFEPLLGHIQKDYIPEWVDWVIVGRLTGYGRKHDPPYDWVYGIVNCVTERGLPIFMKDNLKDIWQDDLIQEMPK